MEIWIVTYDSDVQGAFKTKEDAYNFIVEDFTASNSPIKVDNPDYEKDKEWFEDTLYELKKEYENCSSFSCCDHWFAESTILE